MGGVDVSDVTLRADRTTALTAASIGAKAYTAGSQIGIVPGQVDLGTRDGLRILRHEIAHVVQSRGGTDRAAAASDPERQADAAAADLERGAVPGLTADRRAAVRAFPGDIRTMSITAQLARTLDDTDLTDQLAILDAHITTLSPSSTEFQAVRENQGILQHEQVTRLVQGRGLTSPTDTTSSRLVRFKRGVLLAAQYRLRQNVENLAQWRVVAEQQLPPEALQTQVLAQSALDLQATAARTGASHTFAQWSGEINPYRRNVREHQIRGEWRACTGCHEDVRADEQGRNEPHVGPMWTAPVDALSARAGLPVGPVGGWDSSAGVSGANAQRLAAAVAMIRPVLAPLGDLGYRIIPDDVFSLGSGRSALQLRADILAKIDQRRGEYATLDSLIGQGDISYLQLSQILQEQLMLTDPEVRAAVQAEIDEEHTWAILKIGATLILALLSLVFPPLTLALAAMQFASGMEQYSTGRAYGLGTGGGVFSREQEDSASAMKLMGIVNMAMASAAFASAAPGAVDFAATRAITSSDLAIASRLAQRAQAGAIPEAELLALQQPGLVGRMGQRWADMRQFQILYRGQGSATSEIVSPVARSGGQGASRSLYDAMKAQGMTDLEIAGLTAKWNNQPVPAFNAPPGMAGQPLGGVGIPSTRLPNIAADFAQPTGVIYVMRLPKGMAVPAAGGGWGQMSALEQEWVVFHQIPNGMVVRTLPASAASPLRFDYSSTLGPTLMTPPVVVPTP
ncbi:MAG TPA: DUF4157 domain-containing protein [Motilibacterales bacterium]|nr:DUF4157 domain-containing protein [Motilibacterales bacterium]